MPRKTKRQDPTPHTANRLAEIEANLARIRGNLTPSRPQPWEMQALIVRERDTLRLRVAELETQLDELIDRITRTEQRKQGPKSNRKPTAPAYTPRKRK